MAQFATQVLVRFQHCDPAGIVFYPRYFEMISQSVEEWFAALDSPFPAMHMRDRKGVPVVSIDIAFATPSELGDMLDFRIGVDEVGGASIKITVDVACAGVHRLSANMVLVYMDLDTRKPVRIPDGLRNRLMTYRADGVND